MLYALSALILTVIALVQQRKMHRIRSSIRGSIQLLRNRISEAVRDRGKNQGKEEDTLSLLIERMLEETGFGRSDLSEITSVLLRSVDKQVEWLRVQRDGNDVVVTVDANTTRELRTFMIRIGQGDFYTLLNGVQAD